MPNKGYALNIQLVSYLYVLLRLLQCINCCILVRVRLIRKDSKRWMAESQEDNEEHTHQSVIRGHHIYKDIWSPFTGERLAVHRFLNSA